MTLETAKAACFLLASLAWAGCTDRVALRDAPPRVDRDAGGGFPTSSGGDPTPPPTGGDGGGRCAQVEVLDATCDAVDLACTSETQAQCILNAASSFDGYCEISGGGEVCDGDQLTPEYREYCRVAACLGQNEQACLAEGEASCQSDVCDQIEAIAGACPGYGYDCPRYPREQSECFLMILEDLKEMNAVCMMFDQADLLCLAGAPSLEGGASCAIQACFAITTFDACLGNLEVLCPWVP